MSRRETGQDAGVYRHGRQSDAPPREPADSEGEKRSTSIEMLPGVDRFHFPRVGDPTEGPSSAGRNPVMPYRPSRRPPIAVLCALDDGRSTDGETWRIRKSRFVIGRGRADATIAHDLDISAQHAEIGYRWQDGCYRWHLQDLDSTNGTFIRVSRIVLRSGKHIAIGSRRFQFFDVGQPGDGECRPADSSICETRDYRPPAGGIWQQNNARLVEVNGGDATQTYLFGDVGSHVGSDRDRCAIHIGDDPFVDPVHARVFRDGQGRWVIEDCRSRNGLWLRIQSVYLAGLSGFQLGEQRFTINIL